MRRGPKAPPYEVPLSKNTRPTHDVRMHGFEHRHTVRAALAWLDAQLRPLDGETVSLPHASGRVLAEPIVSHVDVPGFDRSTMDGYAVRADTVDGASSYNPISLRVAGDAMPGAPFEGHYAADETIRIMTGAPMPAGSDAVLPAEWTDADPHDSQRIVALSAISPGKNVGQRGEDIAKGTTVLAAGRLLRPQDRLVAIEKHPEECEALTTALKPFHKTRAVCADGYERLAALLPPQERRGAILIDPPFEAPDEFAQMAGVLGNALRRFATGIYLLWFPIKTKSDADALSGEVLARGATKLLRLQLDVGASAECRLTQTGLLIVNPPYGFDAQMREALSALAAPLGRGRPAQWSVEWLAGEG